MSDVGWNVSHRLKGDASAPPNWLMTIADLHSNGAVLSSCKIASETGMHVMPTAH